jgi:hypothetical protein
MTWLDAVVAAVLISSIIISVIRGLVREILSVLGWIAAFIVANRFAENLAVMLPAAVPGVTLRLITAFAILFIGTLIIAALVSAAIGMLLKASGLVLADRGLGGLFWTRKRRADHPYCCYPRWPDDTAAPALLARIVFCAACRASGALPSNRFCLTPGPSTCITDFARESHLYVRYCWRGREHPGEPAAV